MNRLLLLSACAILGMAVPALADDTTVSSADPVKITSCIVASSVVNSILVRGISRTNGVTIVLANTGTKVASDVTIHGSYNHFDVTDTLRGPFAPSSRAMITKTYNPTVFVGPNASCEVTHVTFADGTSWTMTPKAPASK